MILQISTVPNQNHLLEIKNWLISEYEEFNEGFYCNWSVIEGYFERGELIFLLKDSKAIGFSTWQILDEIVLNIDIVEIHPDHRGNGFGLYLMQQVFNFCKVYKNALVAKLFCSPKESRAFWKKMGLIDCPPTGYAQPIDLMYKPLIEVRNTLEVGHSEEFTIELWNCEPHLMDKLEAKWVWSAKTVKSQLIPPILAPCNRNWNLRFSQNGEIIKESKVKYFSNSKPIDRDLFMIIHELNFIG